jgi:hypothetical protein
VPVVRYLSERQSDPKARDGAREVHADLVRNHKDRGGGCCDANEVCLREHLMRDGNQDIRFANDAEASSYLDRLAQNAQVRIEYLDPLKRQARMSAAGGAKATWQHWLGCWRREGAPAR